METRNNQLPDSTRRAGEKGNRKNETSRKKKTQTERKITPSFN